MPDLSGTKRLVACPDTGLAHDGNENAVHVGKAGKPRDGVPSKAKLATLGKLVENGVVPARLVGHGNVRGAELAGGVDKAPAGAVDRKGREPKLVWVHADDVERLHADGARTAKERHTQRTLPGHGARDVLEDVHRIPP
mgnify:CR=1 FL=1